MIAVLADENEYPAVREFFELFKTPWEFYRDDSNCSVLICAANHVPANSAKIVLVYGSQENSFDRENGTRVRSRQLGAMVWRDGRRIPIYGHCLVFETSGTDVVALESAPEAAVVKVSSGKQAVIRIGFDLFQEVQCLLAGGQPAAYAAIPTLDLHIALLRDFILGCSIPLVEIPPVPDGYNCIGCCTHDVDHLGFRNHTFDHTMIGFLYRATIGSLLDVCRRKRSLRQLATNWLAVLKLPLVYAGLAPDFWNQVERYVEIEKGIASTWFIIPKKGESGRDGAGNRPMRRAARYDAARYPDVINQLQSAGNEIALHGIDAWRDSNAGRQERDIISKLIGTTETGVRMHWLYFDNNSPAALEAAGFSYDSTIGYNQTIGYRAGTTQVFKPMAAENLLELPMHVMDTALFYPNYLNLSPAGAQEKVQSLVANAARLGGVLTVNWHDRSLAPERLWEATYIQTIEQLRANRACFLTAAATVSWFRRRRAVVFERIGQTIKVRVPPAGDPRLPGLCVRRYHACGAPYSETKLTDGSEIHLAA
jgi:hypothetical protein